MAGENKGTRLYAAPSRDKSAASNELNSSAMGYYQFIIHDPDDKTKDPYGHKSFIPQGGNFFDPVTQQRMMIRAILGGKHKGDPASVVREKRTRSDHTWGP
jgi:muramidase (phage lysozyme)